jgi:hypothetical protein
MNCLKKQLIKRQYIHKFYNSDGKEFVIYDMSPKQYFVNFSSGNLTKTLELPYFMFIFSRVWVYPELANKSI